MKDDPGIGSSAGALCPITWASSSAVVVKGKARGQRSSGRARLVSSGPMAKEGKGPGRCRPLQFFIDCATVVRQGAVIGFQIGITAEKDRSPGLDLGMIEPRRQVRLRHHRLERLH